MQAMESAKRVARLNVVPLTPSPSAIGNPPTAEHVGHAYDALADGYDRFHVDAKSLAENDFIARRLARRVGPHTRVLDLGCGTGLLLDLLSIREDRYVGVDVSHGMLDGARRKYPRHRFVQADAQQLDAVMGQFDLVVSLFGSPSYCGLASLARSVERRRVSGGGHFLMYCGPRYIQRSTYINKNTHLLQSYDAAALRDAYPGSRVWGMSCAVDVAPRATPTSIMRQLLAFDAKTAGRIAPDLCFFLVVER